MCEAIGQIQQKPETGLVIRLLDVTVMLITMVLTQVVLIITYHLLVLLIKNQDLLIKNLVLLIKNLVLLINNLVVYQLLQLDLNKILWMWCQKRKLWIFTILLVSFLVWVEYKVSRC